MKAIVISGEQEDLTATMGTVETWNSENSNFAKWLNSLSDRIFEELSVADGDPRQIIFEEVKKLFPNAEVIDTDKPPGPTIGGEY